MIKRVPEFQLSSTLINSHPRLTGLILEQIVYKKN